jgi:hypothetical protein
MLSNENGSSANGHHPEGESRSVSRELGNYLDLSDRILVEFAEFLRWNPILKML